ncbi:hypothetical protein I6F26_13220 [Ensifer sp. IC3342]|nr:hypothetical protein [Ensifer sp. BRP08]MCA1447539.1 hypothetical protein [Ensifer sp. IC3342]
MSASAQALRDEPRWAPMVAILSVFGLLAVLPHHVYVMPAWVSYGVVLAALIPMAVVTFRNGNILWLRIERAAIMLLATVYAANTAAELADMIGIITLHPPETRAVSLLSSSLAIWVTNVLTFSLIYWQIDRGGPYGQVRGANQKPDWLFPQATAPEETSPDWRPLFLDYLSLAYNMAAGFSPADVLPLTRRAKMLTMLESGISLLTLVIVAARAVNVLP